MKYVADKQCPQCGETMEHGILYCGGRSICWMPFEANYAEDRWKVNRKEWFYINDLALTANGAAEHYPTAYHCSKCKKIIVDY